MKQHIESILRWVADDFKSNPIRFVAETTAWIMSISCALLLAITVKNPALWVIYPMWIASSSVFAWSAITRRSFGLLGNYIILAVIDLVGYLRYLNN